MSIHPSLRISAKGIRHRSVLNRIERLKYLSEKGEFNEGDSVFGLPKIKTLRIKIKKEKVAKETTAAAEAGAPAEEKAGEATPAKESSKTK